MPARARAILWLDAGAACTAGLSTLVLRDELAALYGYSSALILFLGVANLAYASYSGSVAACASLNKTPPRMAIDILVTANLAWVAVCTALLGVTFRSASGWGLGQVTVEGLFVGALAVAEWRLVRPHAR